MVKDNFPSVPAGQTPLPWCRDDCTNQRVWQLKWPCAMLDPCKWSDVLPASPLYRKQRRGLLKTPLILTTRHWHLIQIHAETERMVDIGTSPNGPPKRWFPFAVPFKPPLGGCPQKTNRQAPGRGSGFGDLGHDAEVHQKTHVRVASLCRMQGWFYLEIHSPAFS